MHRFNKAGRLISVGAVLLAQSMVFSASTADAAQITSRKLTLLPGTTDAGAKAGGVVKHEFSFTLPSSVDVGSIKFEYCTVAAGTCVIPTGLDTSAATLENQTGALGFTMNNSTPGVPFLYRGAAAAATGPVTYRFGDVTNPTTENLSFYVRINTYESLDTSGTAIDTGAVAASTSRQIVLTGTMPESLIFCTGEIINTTGGVPDCSTATPGAVDFDKLFSPSDTATAESQMAASTNANNGYVISVFGNTMESGSNSIASMGTATTGVRGTGQFGMNLRENTVLTSTPLVGAEVSPASNGTNYKGTALVGYNTIDNFKFLSADNIADSSSPGTAGPTDAQIYTVSYIVNVPGSQPAGTYTTTLTYVCTPSF